MREYELIADWFARNRTDDTGIREMEHLAEKQREGARILDLGCGNGIPIARYLIARGFAVHGIDSSPAMIERFRANCPGAPWLLGDVASVEYFGIRFEAIVAWGVMFHLSPAEQKHVIAKCAAALEPGGKFMFTSGREEGVREGEMNGIQFQYHSLGSRAYRENLSAEGLTLDAEYCDPADNYVYLASKPGRVSRAAR